jgi:four helix bundle suffix protein
MPTPRKSAKKHDAGVILGLIKVTCYLLDHQLKRLEQDFLKEGGLRERMTRARLEVRHNG